MTAKKMADIFFGKFSEVVSPEGSKPVAVDDGKKPLDKKLIFALATLIAMGLILFVFL